MAAAGSGGAPPGRRLARAFAPLLAAAACAGWLAAQQGFHHLPRMPELRLEPVDPEPAPPSEFAFARMAYTDRYPEQPLDVRPWQIDAPAAERHFLQGLSRLSAVNAKPQEAYVAAAGPDIFEHPFLYVVEAGHWDLTDREVESLREYLLRGGFILFDDFHGTEEWAHFMAGIRRIFPAREIVDLDSDDEVFHVLFDMGRREQIPGLQMVYSGRPYERDGVEPHWRGIRDDDGRLMIVINHNMDLGDAWEHADWPEYPERLTAMSYRLAINYVIYAMTH